MNNPESLRAEQVRLNSEVVTFLARKNFTTIERDAIQKKLDFLRSRRGAALVDGKPTAEIDSEISDLASRRDDCDLILEEVEIRLTSIDERNRKIPDLIGFAERKEARAAHDDMLPEYNQHIIGLARMFPIMRKAAIESGRGGFLSNLPDKLAVFSKEKGSIVVWSGNGMRDDIDQIEKQVCLKTI